MPSLFTSSQTVSPITSGGGGGGGGGGGLRPLSNVVFGSPIAPSRSPQLHLAAYRALGLHGWTYDRIECTADQLPGLVAGFGSEWVGVSVTMPGKFAALRFADERAFAHIFAASDAGLFVVHAPVLVTGSGKLWFHVARRNRIAVITYGTGRTNVLSGIVHLVLLAAYLFLTIVP